MAKRKKPEPGERKKPAPGKKPALSKLQARELKPWTTPESLQEMLLEFARVATQYIETAQERQRGGEPGAQDEKVLRDIYKALAKGLPQGRKPPDNPQRTSDETAVAGDGGNQPSHPVRKHLNPFKAPLAYARVESERVLENWQDPHPSEVRDIGLAQQLARCYRACGLKVTESEVNEQIARIRREHRTDPSIPGGDWISGEGGSSKAAGLLLEKLGVSKGWLGTSRGRTAELKKLLEEQLDRYAANRKGELKLIAFFLAAIGMPTHRTPWTALQLYMMKRGAEFSWSPGARPPVLPMGPFEPGSSASTYFDIDPRDFGRSWRYTASRLKQLRRAIEQEFPDFLPDGGWALWAKDRLWQRVLLEIVAMIQRVPELKILGRIVKLSIHERDDFVIAASRGFRFPL